MRTCKKIKSDGTECHANAMLDSDFCFSHNPETKDKFLFASQDGGKVGICDKGSILLDPIEFSDSASIITLLTDTINRIRTVRENGQMDLKTANSIGFLASKLIEARREIQFVERLEKIEKYIQDNNLNRKH